MFNSQTWLLTGAIGIISSTHLLASAQAPPLYQAPYFSVSYPPSTCQVNSDLESHPDFVCHSETRLKPTCVHLGYFQPCLGDTRLHARYPIHSTSKLCSSCRSPEYSNSASGSASFPDRRLHTRGVRGDTLNPGSEWTVHL